MNQKSIDFPTPFESKRLILRSYQPGDGKWYYAMSLRNRAHLLRYEADNVAANIAGVAEAETIVGELAAEWKAKRSFFIGAFEKISGIFTAQIYVGPINWNLPEFQIGYFADVEHEGQGFVTEGVKATLTVLFKQLNAHRVRLECNETNLRSIHVAERCDMIREGYLRENQQNPDGSYSGSFIYGILKSDFTSGEENL